MNPLLADSVDGITSWPQALVAIVVIIAFAAILITMFRN